MGKLETNYAKQMGVTTFREYLNALKTNKFDNWFDDHMNMVQSASLIMKELGIGNRIVEFCDAEKHDNKRVQTFSDFINDDKYKPIIVSKSLENGEFDGIQTRNSEYGYFGDFYEYVAPSNNGLYNTIDSIIIDDTFDRIEKYLPTFIFMGKDCYFPVCTYKDSNYQKVQLEKAELLKSIASKINGVSIEDVESNSNNNFVKVIKMHKENK